VTEASKRVIYCI